jgi:hypothetical protein
MTTPADPPRPPGRPSDYTPELAAEICEFLAEGKSLRWVCEQDGMPSRRSVLRWLRANADFQAAYRVAREYGAEALADEIIDLASQHMEPAAAPVARFRLDAVKWAASKLSPKRWGDTLKAELSGPGGAPLQLQPVAAPPPLTPAEVVGAVKALLREAEQAAVRPDCILRENAPAGCSIQMIVKDVEPLGPHTLVIGSVSRAPFTAQTRVGIAAEPYRPFEVALDLERAHLFDKSTGQVIPICFRSVHRITGRLTFTCVLGK